MSTTAIQAPKANDVTKMMHDLLGLDVTAAKPDAADIYSIAEYVDEAGAVVGYIASDLAGGCRLGAALTQVPVGRVDEAVKDGEMPESLAENLSEIFNVSVNLLAASEGSRIVLGRAAHGSSAEHFEELNTKLDSLTKTDFGFEVARYGVCRLVVAVEA